MIKDIPGVNALTKDLIFSSKSPRDVKKMATFTVGESPDSSYILFNLLEGLPNSFDAKINPELLTTYVPS